MNDGIDWYRCLFVYVEFILSGSLGGRHRSNKEFGVNCRRIFFFYTPDFLPDLTPLHFGLHKNCSKLFSVFLSRSLSVPIQQFGLFEKVN